MSLYVVLRPNPYFKGKFVEDTAEGFVREVELREEEGKWRSMRYIGLEVPLAEVRDYLLRIQNKGIDERGLRG